MCPMLSCLGLARSVSGRRALLPELDACITSDGGSPHAQGVRAPLPIPGAAEPLCLEPPPPCPRPVPSSQRDQRRPRGNRTRLVVPPIPLVRVLYIHLLSRANESAEHGQRSGSRGTVFACPLTHELAPSTDRLGEKRAPQTRNPDERGPVGMSHTVADPTPMADLGLGVSKAWIEEGNE